MAPPRHPHKITCWLMFSAERDAWTETAALLVLGILGKIVRSHAASAVKYFTVSKLTNGIRSTGRATRCPTCSSRSDAASRHKVIFTVRIAAADDRATITPKVSTIRTVSPLADGGTPAADDQRRRGRARHTQTTPRRGPEACSDHPRRARDGVGARDRRPRLHAIEQTYRTILHKRITASYIAPRARSSQLAHPAQVRHDNEWRCAGSVLR